MFRSNSTSVENKTTKKPWTWCEKQTKIIEDQDKKQVEALKVLKPAEHKLTVKEAIHEDQLNEEPKNETKNNKKKAKIVKWKDLVYKSNIYLIWNKYSNMKQ